jgi:hypothetical protein
VKKVSHSLTISGFEERFVHEAHHPLAAWQAGPSLGRQTVLI